jgi:hypothetical protein
MAPVRGWLPLYNSAVLVTPPPPTSVPACLCRPVSVSLSPDVSLPVSRLFLGPCVPVFGLRPAVALCRISEPRLQGSLAQVPPPVPLR